MGQYVSNHPDVSSPIKNKFAQTVVLLFLATYLSSWGNFFDDMFALLDTLQQPLVIDVYLRVLHQLDTMVIARPAGRCPADVAAATAIKDQMRDTGVVARLAVVWRMAIARYAEARPLLCRSALLSLHKYIAWIPIELVVNDEYVAMLKQLATVPVVREAACDCLMAITTKGMDARPKVQMLQGLRLSALVRSCLGEVEQALLRHEDRQHTSSQQEALELAHLQRRRDRSLSSSSSGGGVGTITDDGGVLELYDYTAALSELLAAEGVVLLQCREELEKGEEADAVAATVPMTYEVLEVALLFLGYRRDVSASQPQIQLFHTFVTTCKRRWKVRASKNCP